MKKLITFIIIITILALASVFNISEAIKLIDDEKMQAGIFDELLENELVVAINPNKLFKATATNEDDMHILVKQDLEDIFEKSNLTIANVKNKNGKLYNDTTAIGTGATATADNQKQYKVVLYGDANGDGRICNSMDIDVIRQDYVFNNKAEGAYKIAADLQVDGTLNVRDVQRMTKKYIGQLDGTLVTPFPDEEIPELIITPSEDFELGKGDSENITANINVEWSWDEDSDIADVVVNDDESITVTGKNPGEFEITAIDEFGNEKTIVVTIVEGNIEIADYTKESITVNVSLDGKEIESIEHFYYVSYDRNPAIKSAGTTTETTFEYTTELLITDTPYTFYAEIKTTDGKLYRTNLTNWMMGYVGENPVFNVTATTNEDEATINVEVTNEVEVAKYSYVLLKQNEDGQTFSEFASGESENPEYVFKELEDGTYKVVVVASTEQGAFSTEMDTFKILKTKAIMEITDYQCVNINNRYVKVQTTLEGIGKEIQSIEYFYRYQDTQDTVSVGTTTNTEFIYNSSSGGFNNRKNAILSAIITTTEGKTYNTNEVEWNTGVAPEIELDVEVQEDETTIGTITVTNLEEVKEHAEIAYYSWLLELNGKLYSLGEHTSIDTIDNTYEFTDLPPGKYKLYGSATSTKGIGGLQATTEFTIYGEGHTDDEEVAVAKVKSTGGLYTTVQYAVNAADETEDTVTILKDVEESFIVADSKQKLTVDLNGHKITAANVEYAITNNGNLTIMNSNTESIGFVTAPIGVDIEEQQKHVIITTGDLTITTNNNETSEVQVNLHPADYDNTAATIKNLGSNNTLKIAGGAFLSGTVKANVLQYPAILDENTESTIIIEKANIGGYIGIKKTGSGTINIGSNEQELWGTTEGPSDEFELSIGGTSGGNALIVDEGVEVNFYNGYLQTGSGKVLVNTDGSIHEFDNYREGYGETCSLIGGPDDTKAFYREPFYAENGETLDEEEAVAELVGYPGGKYTSINGARKSAQDAGYTGGTIKLLKDTTESAEFPRGTNFELDLNGYSITGANTDVNAEEGATIKVAGNLVILNSSETKSTIYSGVAIQSGINNIHVTGAGNLELQEGVTVKTTTGGSKVIYKDGTGNITIDGAIVQDASAGGTTGISDVGDSGNIYVYEGKINGYANAILKTGNGNVYVGKDSTTKSGVDGIQRNILTESTTPSLVIEGAVYCIRVGDNTNVYYYNGELQTIYSDSGEYQSICADLDGNKKEYADTRTGCVLEKVEGKNHSFAYVLVSNGVARIKSTGDDFETLAEAVAAAEDNDEIIMLKNTQDTSQISIDKNIDLNLNGKTVNNHFNITGDVVFADSTNAPGTIDTLNDDINSAIEVSTNGSVTLKDGINVKAYTYCIEGNTNTTINVKEANLIQELPSDVSIDSSNTNNAAIKVNGGNLIISDNGEEARVNIYSDRYAIYSDSFETIKIKNSEEQEDGIYKYEIYGDVSALRITLEGSEKKNIEINSGKFSAAPYMDRTVISLAGSIKLDTTGGIIGDLETGYGIRATHAQPDLETYYMPKLCINGSTKVFALQTGIYVGNSRYGVPDTDIELEIGTDDVGNSSDGVQIISGTTGIFVGNYGQTNIKIGGTPDSGYNLDKTDFEQKSPMILAENQHRLGVAIDILSADSTTLELNCQAIIIWNGKYSISSDIGEITTANDESNYEIITDETVDEDRYLKAVYIKKK